LGNVVRKDGSLGLALPPSHSRKIHRIAVAFGSGGEVPIASGNFGKGFIHVMNEEGFSDILNELDTITDFVDYLAAKEELVAHSAVLVEGHESNLLGWYLCHGRKFLQKPDTLVIDHNIWKNLSENNLFQRRKEADSESYRWDSLIELLADSGAKTLNGPEPSLDDFDVALREMARETRFSRRSLGRNVREFLEQAKEGKIRARAIVGVRGVIYVLVYFKAGENDKYRVAELSGRCCAARLKAGHGHTVIGVGIGEYKEGVGATSDLVYMRLDDWSQMEKDAELRGFGYFAGSEMRNVHEQEYPESSGSSGPGK
jgi:hypothetical protein